MIQQNNNVIYVVNLGAEAKRFTHRRCKILTQCQFLKREREKERERDRERERGGGGGNGGL